MSNPSRRSLFGLFAGASALALSPQVFAAAPADAIDALPFVGEYVPMVTARHTVYGLGYGITYEELKDNLFERVAHKRLSETQHAIADDVFENGFHA